MSHTVRRCFSVVIISPWLTICWAQGSAPTTLHAPEIEKKIRKAAEVLPVQGSPDGPKDQLQRLEAGNLLVEVSRAPHAEVLIALANLNKANTRKYSDGIFTATQVLMPLLFDVPDRFTWPENVWMETHTHLGGRLHEVGPWPWLRVGNSWRIEKFGIVPLGGYITDLLVLYNAYHRRFKFRFPGHKP